MNTLFPIFIKVNQVETLLVGGSNVGVEKFQALIANEPQVKLTVVAEFFVPEFELLLQKYPQVKVFKRSFEDRDLDHKKLVILACNNTSLNNHIRNIANQRQFLLNVADTPDLCDFYLGSIVQKGNLKIAVSTNGKSPTIAKRLREFLADVLPEEIDETLSLMQEMRKQLKGDFQAKVVALNEHTKSLMQKKDE